MSQPRNQYQNTSYEPTTHCAIVYTSIDLYLCILYSSFNFISFPFHVIKLVHTMSCDGEGGMVLGIWQMC